MSSLAPPLQPEPRMQGERTLEYRFVVDRTVAEGVLRRAATWLTPDVHAPERPVTYCRTLYLDSQDGAFLRTFRNGATACRARVRQYAVASDLAGEACVTGATAWLEIKRTCGLERAKTRAELSLRQLDRLLVGQAAGAPADIEVPPVLAEVVAGLAERRLRPCLLTWCRRWSLGRSPLRITLDEGIAYCLPEPLAALGSSAEPRAVVARDALAVLEMKLTGAMPGWLEAEAAAIARHLALRHSKFRAGMDALRHARPANGQNDGAFRNAG